ncbi:MAG: hypothetical protein P1U74_03990 [Legionellaceae bacterium]|nr:hypothetical protein [Legionellaceae bacterium]
MHSKISSRLANKVASASKQTLVMPFGARYVPQRKICNWRSGSSGIWTPKHEIIKKPDYEVVIGGVAAGLGLWDALEFHPQSAHSDVLFVCGDDWIDPMKVGLYGDELWGQCFKDMPDKCKNILLEKWPRLQPEDRLNLEQAQYMRHQVILRVASLRNVTLIRDEVTGISESGEISFNKHSKICVPTENSYFYNHARTPNVIRFPVIGSDGKLSYKYARPHSVGYSMDKDDFLGKYSVLFGTSVSSTWSYQHFEVNKQFTETICLGEHGTKWQMVPANESIQVDKITRLMLPPSARSLNLDTEQFEDYKSSKIKEMFGVEAHGMDKDEKDLKYQEYCHAKGYATNFYDPTTGKMRLEGKKLGFEDTDVKGSQENLVIQDVSPKSYMSAAGISACPGITSKLPNSRKTDLNMTRREITSVRNIPTGSLIDSYFHYQSNTFNPPSNLRGIFPFILDESLENRISDGLVKYSIKLNKSEFFKFIKDKICILHHSPSEDELHNIWKSSFMSSHPGVTEDDWNEFKISFTKVVPSDVLRHSRHEEFKMHVEEYALKERIEIHTDVLFRELENKVLALDHCPSLEEMCTFFIDSYIEANPDSTDIDLDEFQNFIISTNYRDLMVHMSCHNDADTHAYDPNDEKNIQM